MPDVLPSRPTSTRNYAAVAVFLAVYAVTLLIVLAPREMIIAAESGSVVRDGN